MLKIYYNDKGGIDLVDESSKIRYENLLFFQKSAYTNPLFVAINNIDNLYLPKLVNYNNIVRRFENRNDDVVIDSISSRNAILSQESSNKFLDTNIPFTLDFNDDEDIIAYNFFDKSDITIWDDYVRSSDKFDDSNHYLWDSSELNQEFIYEHCLIKYQLWIKKLGNNIIDIILYDIPLSNDEDICATKQYVNKGEDISTLVDDIFICYNDNLI